MQVNLIFSLLLDHLKSCGGCIGHRKIQNCKHARACASAEVLFKRGLVANSQDLLLFGTADNARSAKDYSRKSNRDYADIGPCEAEPSCESI